ncbi:hypothetical protein GCM10010191_03880 [Actinomadura vinacea]|uniref:Winged helix DNA-binding domain-containing protein n=1 Tax=Actinomadura vinacea TaxID=115336 RepID=A0ABP5VD70_9ACTN
MTGLDTPAAVAALDPDITVSQIGTMCAQDPARFSLVAVAEATLNRVPAAVTHWLWSSQVCRRWERTLVIQEGAHQLSWWNKIASSGIDHPDALSADRRLAAIRQRRLEAHQIVTGRRADSLPAHDRPLTPTSQRLIDLSDLQFQNLVARDIQQGGHSDDLAHPALAARWREALIDLGRATFTRLGIKLGPHHLDTAFAVPDRHLIRVRHDVSADEWASKLTFLTHLRARLIECDHIRLPGTSPEPIDTRPASPEALDSDARLLRLYGWDVRWISNGRRVWLDAWHGPNWRTTGRLIVTVSRRRAAGPGKWGRPAYVFHGRGQRGYIYLTGREGLEYLARTNPRSAPARYFKSKVPETRDHLSELVPPDGYRWRHPYPPELHTAPA